MFKNIFGPASQPAAEKTERAFTDATAGETETVRRIVGRLESMPPERARLVASAAYILARAANADMNITDEETQLIEQQLQERGMLDEPTAVLVAEMARLQARTVGDTEDYVVTREFKAISTMEERHRLLRACFLVMAADDEIDATEAWLVNRVAEELDVERADLNTIRAEFYERLSSVKAAREVAQK